MIEEIFEYIKKNGIVSKKELIKKFQIDDKFIDYLVSYAKKRGYKIDTDKKNNIKCSKCPYKNKF